MTSPIRAAVIGTGVHGLEAARLAARAGIEVVAAADPFLAGTDLGAASDEPLLDGVTIVASIDDIAWSELSIDVTLVIARLEVEPLVSLLEAALMVDTDVLTIAEDVFDLQTSHPELHHRLDAAARRVGRTLLATGVQDIAWMGLALAATGMQQSLTGIRIAGHLGVDGYQEAFLSEVGIGITHEEFEHRAELARSRPAVLGAILPVMARALGLTVTSEVREIEPYLLAEEIESITLKRPIHAGDPAGRRDVSRLQTTDGIDLSAELITSVLPDRDDFEVTLEGVPHVTLGYRMIPGPAAVNGTLINRIPDVIAAPPGVISASDLPLSPYRRPIAKL